MRYRAAITIFEMGYSFQPEIERLNALGVDAVYRPLEGTKQEDAVIAALRDCDFVLAGSELWSRSVFEALAGKLKLFARLGVGIDNVDVAAATEFGVAVTNAPGGNSCSVAQHTVTLMLDLLRSVSLYDRAIRTDTKLPRRLAADLFQSTVGFVGFGRIAQETAALLAGFQCNLLAYDTCWDQAAAAALQVRRVSLPALAAESDLVSVHVPLLAETRGMLDRRFFAQMKPTAYLINTSRGLVIREADLIDALRSGTIAGAGLDVFEQPLLHNPLCGLPNTVLTPYVAFSGRLGNTRTAAMAIDSIEAYLSGRPMAHLLNPQYVRNVEA